jgi:hypothetical protein
MKKLLLLLSFLLTLSSCVDSDTPPVQVGLFPLGTWTVGEWQENGFTLNQTQSLPENTYGYIFQKNGKLINRSNSGFCGTPPIITADFEGLWSNNGETITLEMGFWGGTIREEWKLTQVNGSRVTIERLNVDYQFDE